MNVNGPRVGKSLLSSSRLHTARTIRGSCCLAVAAILVMGIPLAAQEPKTVPDSGPSHARTPEDVLPYRNFQEPYHRFFQSASEFRGTGRDDLLSAPPAAVRIGFMGPVGSAPDSDLGQQMLEGVRLAIEEANAEGRYEGIPFELVVRPDSGLWGATSNEMVAFSYAENVLAVIGSVDGANTHIVLRVTLKTEVPMVNTGDTDPTLTETNIPWILRCLADDRQQGYALAHHIFRECGITKVAALRVNDRHGRFGMAKFRDAAALPAARIRDSADIRIALQNGLAAETWYGGVSGLFRFDKSGKRIDESAGGVQAGMADTRRSEN